MNKLKSIILGLIIILCIVFVPKLLNFMETQHDILKINNQSQIFTMNNKQSIVCDNIKISQDVPIPEDIKNKMIENYKNQKEQQRLEQERIKLEQERKAQEEQKAKESQKLIQTSKVQTPVSSRGNLNYRAENEWIKFTATAYCGCSKCCGKSTGKTASGTKATQGRTVAMPSSYKFGTKIEIQGIGTYIVEDRGGAIKGNRIDIYFSNHQSALNFGRKTVYLKVVQ